MTLYCLILPYITFLNLLLPFIVFYCRNLEKKQTANQKSNPKQTEQKNARKKIYWLVLLKNKKFQSENAHFEMEHKLLLPPLIISTPTDAAVLMINTK